MGKEVVARKPKGRGKVIVLERYNEDCLAIGDTLEEVWNNLVSDGHDADPSKYFFYVVDREVEVEVQIVEKQQPVVVG